MSSCRGKKNKMKCTMSSDTFVKNPWPNTILGRLSPADISIAGQ
jgi:hypothetical protein